MVDRPDRLRRRCRGAAVLKAIQSVASVARMSEAISGIARKRVCSCATRFAVTCVALAQAQSRGLPATNQPDGQITADFPKLESSHGIKNIPLHTPGKSPLQARPVSPDERGGSRSSRTRGGMRWTRVRRKTNAAVSRTAKACGSGTAVLVSSSREAGFSGATVARKPFAGKSTL